MRIGYARVSTFDQNLNLQTDALTSSGCEKIYHENISGKSKERPELTHCLHALRKGDILVVWRLDRLGRSLADLVQIISKLEADGIGFESLTERIETITPTGKLVFHIFAALAEFERNLISERTHAGLKAARARGRKGGRPQKLTPTDIRDIKALYAAGDIPIKDIAARFKVTPKTIYNALG